LHISTLYLRSLPVEISYFRCSSFLQQRPKLKFLKIVHNCGLRFATLNWGGFAFRTPATLAVDFPCSQANVRVVLYHDCVVLLSSSPPTSIWSVGRGGWAPWTFFVQGTIFPPENWPRLQFQKIVALKPTPDVLANFRSAPQSRTVRCQWTGQWCGRDISLGRYIHIHACTYIHIHTRTHAHPYTHPYIHTSTHPHIHTHTHTHIFYIHVSLQNMLDLT
jgi:hypothetical protein